MDEPRDCPHGKPLTNCAVCPGGRCGIRVSSDAWCALEEGHTGPHGPRDCPHGVQHRKRLHLCAACMEPEIDRLREIVRELSDVARTAIPFLRGAHFTACSIFGPTVPLIPSKTGTCDCGTTARAAAIKDVLEKKPLTIR